VAGDAIFHQTDRQTPTYTQTDRSTHNVITTPATHRREGNNLIKSTWWHNLWETAKIHTGWPLSRQSEIPRQFPDGSRHSSTVSGGSRNATVHDPKPYIPGLLISKYRVSLIVYRRYFSDIDGVIVDTFEKCSDKVSPILLRAWNFDIKLPIHCDDEQGRLPKYAR